MVRKNDKTMLRNKFDVVVSILLVLNLISLTIQRIFGSYMLRIGSESYNLASANLNMTMILLAILVIIMVANYFKK